MIIHSSQNTSGDLQELMRSFQKEQDDLLKEGAPATMAAPTVIALPERFAASRQAACSPMQSHTFAATRDQSKYTAARKAGQDAVHKQASRQMAVLNAGLAELNSLSETEAANYASRNLIGRKAARRMMEEGQQTVREESERNMEEIKDKIEEKAQEATAPKDETGKPMEGLPTEGTSEAPPMPEISDSTPAPVPDVAAAPTPNGAQAAPAPRPEVAALAAPATPSIDITV